MKCVSNDYTNPNTNPKTLSTYPNPNPKTLRALTLTLNDPRCLINKSFPQFQARKLPCQRTRYVLKFVCNNYTNPTGPMRH